MTDTDVPLLLELFRKSLDAARCEAGHPLAVRPTLIVLLRDPNEALAVAGSRVEGQRAELAEQLSESFGSAEVELRLLDSADDLRNAVAQRLRSRIELLQPLVDARARGEAGAYVRANWRRLPPPLFTALRVALAGVLPGVRIGMAVPSETPVSDLDQLEPFAEMQASVWLAMCMTWFSGDDHSATLEEDLSRFVDDAPVIEGADEKLFEMFDQLQSSKELMLHSRYCLEAVRASLYVALGRPIPRSDLWAELFFEHELRARIQGDDFPAKFRAMTVSDERARKTIGFQDVEQAIARRLDDVLGSDQDSTWKSARMSVMQAIATKAGHDASFARVLSSAVLRAPAEELLEVLLGGLQKPDPLWGLKSRSARSRGSLVCVMPSAEHGSGSDRAGRRVGDRLRRLGAPHRLPAAPARPPATV